MLLKNTATVLGTACVSALHGWVALANRLILELQFSPAEAYQHLNRILEQVNAITSALFTAQVYEDDAAAEAEAEEDGDAAADDNGFFAMMEDDNYDDGQYFDPARGNVVFASAIDGWGFTLNQFASILSKKFKCRAAPLQNVLWGDYYMTKEKGKLRVKKGAAGKGKAPLFVVGVLQTIWDIYDGVCISKDKTKMAKILKTLALKVSARDYQHPDPKVYLRALFGQWLPLARSILGMVCRVVPPPTSLTAKRASKLLYGTKLASSFAPEVQAAHRLLSASDDTADGDARGSGSTEPGVEAPLVAFVSKMVPVSVSQLPASRPAAAAAAAGSDGVAEQQARRAALIAKRKAEGKDQAPPPRPSEDDDYGGSGGGGGAGGGTGAGDIAGADSNTARPAVSRPAAARPVIGRPVARPVMGRPNPSGTLESTDANAATTGGADAAAAAGLVLADDASEKPAVSASIMAWAQSVAPLPPSDVEGAGGDMRGETAAGAAGGNEPANAITTPEIMPVPTIEPVVKSGNEGADAASRRHAAMETARRLASGDVDAAAASIVRSSGGGVNGGVGSENASHVMIAYTRIFSGTLRPGQQVHVLGPKYDPACPDEHSEVVTVDKLYIIMGRDLIMVDEAPPGSVVGILGLEGHVLKTVTLSSTPNCPSVGKMNTNVKPIVRVVLDATNIIDMPKLKRGMKLLYQADPCCEVLVQGSGEHVLVCAGEVHVERCVVDLRERFCPGVEFTVSKPIVPLRETIVAAPTVDMTNEPINDATNAVDAKLARGHYLLEKAPEPEESGVVTVPTSNGHLQFKMRAIPLPAAVVELLTNEETLLQQLYESRSALAGDEGAAAGTPGAAGRGGGGGAGRSTANEALVEAGAALYTALKGAFADAGGEWVGAESKIIAFGPRQSGANIIMSSDAMGLVAPFFASFFDESAAAAVLAPTWLHSVDVGFQLMTQSGPLSEEPMIGVAFVVEGVVAAGGGGGAGGADAVEVDGSGYTSGEVIAAIKEACKWAFLAQPVRLLTAFYLCDMVVKAASLGKVYVNQIIVFPPRICSRKLMEYSDISIVLSGRQPATSSLLLLFMLTAAPLMTSSHSEGTAS